MQLLGGLVERLALFVYILTDLIKQKIKFIATLWVHCDNEVELT